MEIVTVFSHRGGRFSNGSFTLLVSPHITVGHFLTLLKDCPLNNQRGRAWNKDYEPKLVLHDPSRLGPWKEEGELAKTEELDDIMPLPIP